MMLDLDLYHVRIVRRHDQFTNGAVNMDMDTLELIAKDSPLIYKRLVSQILAADPVYGHYLAWPAVKLSGPDLQRIQDFVRSQ
jgi:hypothetical protein